MLISKKVLFLNDNNFIEFLCLKFALFMLRKVHYNPLELDKLHKNSPVGSHICCGRHCIFQREALVFLATTWSWRVLSLLWFCFVFKAESIVEEPHCWDEGAIPENDLQILSTSCSTAGTIAISQRWCAFSTMISASTTYESTSCVPRDLPKAAQTSHPAIPT